MEENKTGYTLYTVEGHIRDMQKLTPITESAETHFLHQLFEQVRTGNTVQIIRREKDGSLTGITIRNIQHDRQYILELIGEIRGAIKFHT